MKKTNNNNEFELFTGSPRPVSLPYIRLKTRKPKGFLNLLQMPRITDDQRRRLKKSLDRRDGQ